MIRSSCGSTNSQDNGIKTGKINTTRTRRMEGLTVEYSVVNEQPRGISQWVKPLASTMSGKPSATQQATVRIKWFSEDRSEGKMSDCTADPWEEFQAESSWCKGPAARSCLDSQGKQEVGAMQTGTERRGEWVWSQWKERISLVGPYRSQPGLEFLLHGLTWKLKGNKKYDTLHTLKWSFPVVTSWKSDDS